MSTPIPNSTFLQEAEDLLAQVEEIALAVRPGAAPGEAVHQLFRAFHTIKGSGAMFGFDEVARFTHHVETVLDRVREGTLAVSDALVNLVLRSKDQIKALLESSQNGTPVAATEGEKLIQELNGLLGDTSDSGAETQVSLESANDLPSGGAAEQSFKIWFRPAAGLMASGTHPVMLLDELRGLGCCRVAAHTALIPTLEEIQPDQCYLAWEIELCTSKGLNAIKDVFIFVEDESELRIEPASVVVPPRPEAVSSAASSPAATIAAPEECTKPTSGPAANVQAVRRTAAKDATVRVSSERLDRLVALVGEMVMNQSRLSQVAGTATIPNLGAPVEELERLVAELRDTVLGIRMMPIGTTFSRYKRLVHDLSAELGKEILLVTEGAETELDKTVLDQLGDPLVHLIRNSIDHGIETMQERDQAGKARQGSIRLAAAHVGSNVVITIQDDGRGLNAEAIRAKAVEKRLIGQDAKLSLDEIYKLIFLPGFSTAKEVTSVSGRGVGMDVVRRQIDALRGAIHLASEPGKGTTVSLTLPLTLAIIDGLLVEVGRDQFIIPMSAVAENVELARAERSRKNGRNLIAVRGELVPYLCLRDDFEMGGEEPETEKVVILRHGSERVGLVVDRVLGSHQTVIQSLGRFYRNIEVVSGATIMGDGRVALILDLAGVLRRCSQLPATPSSRNNQSNN